MHAKFQGNIVLKLNCSSDKNETLYILGDLKLKYT